MQQATHRQSRYDATSALLRALAQLEDTRSWLGQHPPLRLLTPAFSRSLMPDVFLLGYLEAPYTLSSLLPGFTPSLPSHLPKTLRTYWLNSKSTGLIWSIS